MAWTNVPRNPYRLSASQKTYHNRTFEQRLDLLFRLAEAQNWRCCYCHERMDGDVGAPDCATIEHVQPMSKGGVDEWSNMAAACKKCNQDLGAKDWTPILKSQPTSAAGYLGDILGPALKGAA